MIESSMEYSGNKKEMYEEVAMQLGALFEDCPHMTANLANASALLNQAMKEINWVGFYLMENNGNEGDFQGGLENESMEERGGKEHDRVPMLVLGPFQGKPACVEIKIGKGVCGTAVERDEVMLVRDVHDFPGHIACDGASRSEIVLPIHANGKIIGVLDIDSPILARFDEEDQTGLERIVEVIEGML